MKAAVLLALLSGLTSAVRPAPVVTRTVFGAAGQTLTIHLRGETQLTAPLPPSWRAPSLTPLVLQVDVTDFQQCLPLRTQGQDHRLCVAPADTTVTQIGLTLR